MAITNHSLAVATTVIHQEATMTQVYRIAPIGLRTRFTSFSGTGTFDLPAGEYEFMSLEGCPVDKVVSIEFVAADADPCCDATTGVLEDILAALGGDLTVVPGDGWEALFQAAMMAAIENAAWPELEVTLNGEEITVNGTVALDAATLAALEDINTTTTLTPETISDLVAAMQGQEVNLSAQNIADLVAALEAGTLNVVVESGNLTVDGTVDIGNFDDLVTALDGLNVVVSGTVELGAATLAALENITVTIDTSAGPVAITGAVTIDQSGGPLQVEVTNFPDGFNVDNFQDLVDRLEASTDLNVTVDALPDIVIDADQFQELLDAIAASDVDDTDDDVQHSHSIIKTHCVDGEPVHSIIRVTSRVDPDGVATEETTVVGYLHEGLPVQDLPLGAVLGSCPESCKTLVHTCGWTADQALNARWWNDPDTTGGAGGNAVDIFAVTGGDDHLMSMSFVAGTSGATHVNGAADDTAVCTMGATNRGVLAPSYVSGITGASDHSFQHETFGWVIVPEGQGTYTPAIEVRGNSVYGMYAGPSDAACTQQFWGPYNAGGTYQYNAAPLILDNSYIKLAGLGTLVYVKVYVSNGRGFGGFWLGEVDSAGVFTRTTNPQLSCAFPEVSRSVRCEEAPYTFDASLGESPEPCADVVFPAATMNGIDYETCFADDDGRTILINTDTGDLVEVDGSAVPAGVSCAPVQIAPGEGAEWVTRVIDGSGTGAVNPSASAGGEIRSFTITADRANVNVTLASGNTMQIRGRSSRTWTAHDGDFLDGLPTAISGSAANALWDIIWEELV